MIKCHRTGHEYRLLDNPPPGFREEVCIHCDDYRVSGDDSPTPSVQELLRESVTVATIQEKAEIIKRPLLSSWLQNSRPKRERIFI